MLYTLLPPLERKILHREYARRTAIVFLFAVSVAGTIGIGSLLPAFIRAGAEEASARSQLDTINKAEDKNGLTDIRERVAVGQTLVGALTGGADRERLSLLAESIVRQRQTVRLDSLALDFVSTSSVQAMIAGIAPTRDALVSFKSRLEAGGAGNVDLPVSELAKSTNVPFSIKITFPIP